MARARTVHDSTAAVARAVYRAYMAALGVALLVLSAVAAAALWQISERLRDK